ncbi:MAG: hypothetical protein K5636_07320 [Bacteroidales bacterium]|nr:hypothetical protein [Bacteroidales bacterium]
MKKFLSFLFVMVLGVATLFAQAPEKFTYQAVVRNSNNALQASVPVGVRVSILQGSASGAAVYVETHNVTTNINGLMSLAIGEGTVSSGTFANINWSDGPYFLKVETDPNGGVNYSIESVQQLLSVPFALYAKEAGNGFSGDYNDLTNAPTDLSDFNNDVGFVTMSQLPDSIGGGILVEVDPVFSAWDKDYADLINTPTIPTVPTNLSAFTNDADFITLSQVPVQQNADWNATDGVQQILNKPSLATVATTGSYADLTNKPDIPTTTNDLVNNSGFITLSQVPVQQNADWNATSGVQQILNKPTIPTVPDNVSAFTNDAGYVTFTQLEAILSAMQDHLDSLQNIIDSVQGVVDSVQTIVDSVTFVCGTSTVRDIDGNVYATLKIGNQCWMKENLRTTRFADGTTIPVGTTSSYSTAYRYAPDSNMAYVPTYGYLYNWSAAMHGASTTGTPTSLQGVCPTGWHLPTDGEWTEMLNYVDAQDAYRCNSTTTFIAKALASTTGWNASTITCAPGNDPTANNSTGFNAQPAAYFSGSYLTFGNVAAFWTSTAYSSTSANCVNIHNGIANIVRGFTSITNGRSVRCVYGTTAGGGTSAVVVPTVTTTAVSAITNTTAVSGGNVTADGGASVTDKGICWNTTGTPTVADAHTSNGAGTGTFTANITGLTEGTTYYVRAYATNSAGTAYGNQVSFVTTSPTGFACGTSTVNDYDGNVYNTVLIGTQCWTKENMRATHYSDGTEIAMGTTFSATTPYRYNPDNDADNVSTYGYLYNWAAAMHSANYSGPVQGICPTGWHVPTDAEWTTMSTYVSSQSQYVCGSSNLNIAKALAAVTSWNTYTGDCSVGNTPSTNNATDFSALAASYYSDSGSYFALGTSTYFWSSTIGSGDNVWARYIRMNSPTFNNSERDKKFGYSVRCLLNE